MTPEQHAAQRDRVNASLRLAPLRADRQFEIGRGAVPRRPMTATEAAAAFRGVAVPAMLGASLSIAPPINQRTA